MKKIFPILHKLKDSIAVNTNKAIEFGNYVYANPIIFSRKYNVFTNYINQK